MSFGASAGKESKERLADTRLKIAVFIDFDNIEIGVKSTLGVQFDIGVVLEALKERGDVVSKIAYGDWTRAGDYSRSLTQHATKLVQRNLTPGGDKNGADINLALDALEMAFTHSHINAYVIVGGDSDFITLVEKLKQYDKQIFVVGGRAFTSLVMQRNCHEFIAYENLVGSRRSPGSRAPDRAGRGCADDLARAGCAARAPRAEGAGGSRGLAAARPAQEHAAAARLDVLRTHVRRRQLPRFRAEARRRRPRGASRSRAATCSWSSPKACRRAAEDAGARLPQPAGARRRHREPRGPASAQAPAPSPAERPPPPSRASADGIREVRRLFQSAQNPPRWPMYIRQAKQFLRNVDASFDERKFGFASLVDLMRACQRDGLFRIERDRQGVMRIFPGNVMQVVPEPVTVEPEETEESGQPTSETRPSRNPSLSAKRQREPWLAEPRNAAEQEVVDGDVLQEMEAPQPVVDGEAEPLEAATPPRRRRPRAAPRAQGARKTADTAAPPRARKTPAKARSPRAEIQEGDAIRIGWCLLTAGRSAVPARRPFRAEDGCGAR